MYFSQNFPKKVLVILEILCKIINNDCSPSINFGELNSLETMAEYGNFTF